MSGWTPRSSPGLDLEGSVVDFKLTAVRTSQFPTCWQQYHNPTGGGEQDRGGVKVPPILDEKECLLLANR